MLFALLTNASLAFLFILSSLCEFAWEQLYPPATHNPEQQP